MCHNWHSLASWKGPLAIPYSILTIFTININDITKTINIIIIMAPGESLQQDPLHLLPNLIVENSSGRCLCLLLKLDIVVNFGQKYHPSVACYSE